MAFTVHKEITMGKLKTLIFLPMYETIFFIAIKFKSCQNSQDKDGLSLSRHNPVTLKLYINPHLRECQDFMGIVLSRLLSIGI